MRGVKYVIADLYGDSADLYLFAEAKGLSKAFNEFRKADNAYYCAPDKVKYHGGFTDFMTKKGFPPMKFREVVIEP